jgi:hypothetical protein
MHCREDGGGETYQSSVAVNEEIDLLPVRHRNYDRPSAEDATPS